LLHEIHYAILVTIDRNPNKKSHKAMEKILTVEDVAALLQVKPITVREMFREKRLRAFKMGKAWRTTESMLREDIESLAQGRNPQPLEEAAAVEENVATPQPVRKSVPKKPAQTASVAAPPPAAPLTPTPAAQPVPEADEDVTQQLLF
jgi:excisionase family DNA binding protein